MTTLTSQQQKEVLQLATSAKTVAEADELEAMIIGLIGEHRRPVGDMEDNIGAINASSDPRLALNERYTNGIDAIIELMARKQYGDDIAKAAAELQNPRRAAQLLLNVPEAGPGAMKAADRQKLAELVQLTLLESGDSDRPTAVIRDKGIGQTPTALPGTILSLHRGNKRDKPFLMGVYGWGGSNALGFAERTIVASRRHPEVLDGASDGIGLTLVRRIYEPSMRTPAYFYLVGSDNEVLTIDPNVVDEEFEPGAHVAHVAYDLTIKGGLINQYNFFSAALFEPVLPVFLGSFRNADSHPGRRTLIGTGGRLKASAADEDSKAEGTKVSYKSSSTIDLGADRGRVRANVWVVDKEGAKPTAEVASGFVSADSAITVTLNGQRQETEKREWIKRHCKFPHLFRRMVVQIEADEMTQEAKVEAFASTRERLRGQMHDKIFGELIDLLKADKNLENLERQLRDEALKHTAERASDKDLDKLRRAIGKLGGRTREVEVDVEVDVAVGAPTPGGGGGGQRDTDDSALPDIPTTLEFDRHELTAEAGGAKKRIMVTIDAKNGYLPDHESDLTITVVGPAGETENVYPNSRSGLMGGKAQWLISATEDAELGEYKLVAELTVGSVTLTDSMMITVIERREKGTGGKRTIKQIQKKKKEIPVGPQVNWVRKDDWDQYNYTSSTVGHVDEGTAGVDIYLNLDFDKLAEVLQNPTYSANVVEARKSSYMVPTALGLYRIHQLDAEADLNDPLVDGMQRIVADSVLLATDPDSILGVGQEDDAE